MLPDSSTWEIPEHTVTEFHSRRTRYCICIPIINEGERIKAQLERMRDISEQADILIADGGSTDGSVTSETLKKFMVRTLLVKTGPGKLSAQIRMAFAYALREGYEGIVTIDGSNKDDPNAIPLFIDALNKGFDHIQGSRYIKGGVAVNTPWLRSFGIKLIHAPLISLAAGFPYTDTTNGFRAYSRNFLVDPRVAPFRNVFSAYELHYYLAIQAPRLGYRVEEIPVTRKYPDKGSVPTKISPIKGNLLIIRTLVGACLHRFDPPQVTKLKKRNGTNA